MNIHISNTLQSSLKNYVYLVTGLIFYFFTKKTPKKSYQSLINLFCLTKGRSSDLLARVISISSKPYTKTESVGILGSLSHKSIDQIIDTVRKSGFYIFEERLSQELCDKLVNIASTIKYTTRIPGSDEKPSIETEPNYLDLNNLIGSRYDAVQEDLIQSELIQDILGDANLISIANSYLKSKPILDVIGLWWNFPFTKEADIEAAQHYHFDMDRIKWVKVFIYLTDVSPENGPHKFISGSHNSEGIPEHLLEKGYSRLSDEEVNNAYDKNQIIEFCGPKGTIIIEDTRGLHKAQHLKSGNRLMLQIQYSNCLFGSASRVPKFYQIKSKILANSIGLYPKTYSQYLKS